jgi:signal transduction histidine kinase
VRPERPKDAGVPRANGAAAPYAPVLRGAVVVGVLAALGWLVPFVGLVVPTSLAVGVMTLAAVGFVWGPQMQGLVAAVGIAAFVWCAPGSALPERLPSLIFALAGGGVVSIFGASMMERHREGDRRERKRNAERIQQALSGLEIRAGVGGLTHGSAAIDADDPTASIERIAAELGRQRVEQRKEILHEREMNSHFIGQAAHEFRTPLAVIQTAAEALKLYSGRMSSHAQAVRLTKIEESVQQMTDLLRNALTFSRADAGKIKCERQAVDLRAIAQQVARDVQASFGERAITVNVRGAARLPQLDESLAREILINLMTNAAKYSPDGGPIEVDVITGATDVRIRVTDHGIGIAPGDIGQVFEAFRRGANVGDLPGTGLGLAITKRAVEVHGGTISVESKLGAGTTFTVHLPERVEQPDPLSIRRSA